MNSQRLKFNVLKKQRLAYSGKKKKHTRKALVIVDGLSHQILHISKANGTCHDLKIFKTFVGILLFQTQSRLWIEDFRGF